MHIFDFGEAINHSIAYSHKSDDSRYAKSGASSPGPAGVLRNGSVKKWSV